eukprot:5950010-Prymnesium_polylepis.1
MSPAAALVALGSAAGSAGAPAPVALGPAEPVGSAFSTALSAGVSDSTLCCAVSAGAAAAGFD